MHAQTLTFENEGYDNRASSSLQHTGPAARQLRNSKPRATSPGSIKCMMPPEQLCDQTAKFIGSLEPQKGSPRGHCRKCQPQLAPPAREYVATRIIVLYDGR